MTASPPPATATVAAAGPAPQEAIEISDQERSYYAPEDAEEAALEPTSPTDASAKKRKLDETTTDVATATPSTAAPATATTQSTFQAHVPTDTDAELKAIGRLLGPFTREQIVSILTAAAMQHKSIYNEIRTMASQDVAHRKLFVRGLSWETTTVGMHEAFGPFGKIAECTVIMDRNTGRSKGFGFVTFEDMDSAEKVLAAQPLMIEGRSCACNLAAVPENPTPPALKYHARMAAQQHPHQSHHQPQSSYGGGQHSYHQPQPSYGYTPAAAAPIQHGKVIYADLGPSGDESDRKLFLRGLDYNTTSESVTAEFQKYGDLEEVTIAKDRITGKSKGFAFIIFRHVGSAKRALANPQKYIDGRATHCNLARSPPLGVTSTYGQHHQSSAPPQQQQPNVYRPPNTAAAPQVMGYQQPMYQQQQPVPAATPYMGYAPAAVTYAQQPPPQEMYHMMAAPPQYAQQQPMQTPQPPAQHSYYRPNAGAAKP